MTEIDRDRLGWTGGHPAPDPRIRRAFLDARRQSHAWRMTEIHAATYDADWGAIPPAHARFLASLLSLTRPSGMLLDAACGTGRFWPAILASGRTLVGVDQAEGMLAQARRKHPAVPIALLGIAELPFTDLFDAVLCVDALENVGPEDWPGALTRLVTAARPGAPLWLTVELPEGETALRAAYQNARSAGYPVVPGEDFDGVGYHFHPSDGQLDGWLAAAGVERLATHDEGWYRQLLLRRPPGGG